MKKIVILAVSSLVFFGAILNGMTNSVLLTDSKTKHTFTKSAMFVPVTQASNLTLTNVQPTTMTATWTRGSGTGCLVFVKAAVIAGNQAPVNGTTYTPNTIFGSGSQIGATGWYCVYSGSGTSVTITGFTAGTNYRVEVLEYDGVFSFNSSVLTSNILNKPLTPTTQANTLLFTNIQLTQMDVKWTRGTGSTSCAVFVFQGTSGNASPVNNTIYTANTVFGSGTQAGAGWYCVFNGSGTTITVTGLTPGNDYRIMVIEYNGTAGGEQYLTTTVATNPLNKPLTPTLQASNITFTNVQPTTMVVNWTRGNGVTGCVVFVCQTNSGSALPANNTTYTANAAFGSGTQISPATGWYYVYKGTGTTVTVTGLIPGNDYRVMVCEYNGILLGEQYLTSTSTNNPLNKPVVPTIQASNVVFNNVLFNQMDISWTRGNGEYCLVFMKQAASGTPTPVNNTTYIANATFKSGTQITPATGWYCIYKGIGTGVTVTNLTSNLPYQVVVCEFNGNLLGEQYSVNYTLFNNPANKTTPPKQATNIVFSSVLSTSMNVAWSNGDGGNRVVFIKQTSIAESVSPLNGVTYSASTTYGSGSQIGTGWYCVYNGTSNNTNVFGLTPGNTYRVMVCEYKGIPGNELFNTSTAIANPSSIQLSVQASSIVFSNIMPTSMDIAWSRGSGSGCIVFVKPAVTIGNATPAINTTYNDNSIFGTGSPEGTGWYCVYKGTGTTVSATNLTAGTDYRVMVCEYTGTPGSEQYNITSTVNNPLNKPIIPTTQATNIAFSNVLSNSMTILWKNGNGSNRAVFIKQTSIVESASPSNYTTYSPSSTYGTGIPLGTGWYCIYNGSGTSTNVYGNTGMSTNVYGLTAGSTYRVMVCDYNGTPGNEQYNTSSATLNPLSVQLSIQASNLVFSNVLPTSMDISWSRGSGNGCIVFVKPAVTTGNTTPINNTTYNANSIFGSGDIESTGWYCVYKGTGTNLSLTNLTTGIDYRVMVCEYIGTPGSEQYNTSSTTNNPLNKPIIPTSQATNVSFSNVLSSTMAISWSNGNGGNRAVFIKQTPIAESASPSNYTTYMPSTTYGTGIPLGTGWYCIYNGSGTSVNVYGLTAGSTYRVMVCDYNGTPGNEQYNTNLAIGNPATTTLITQATNIVFSSVLPTSMDLSWTRGGGNGCVVFVKQTNSGNALLTNNTTYNDNSIFGSGSSEGTWYCVYKGSGTHASVTGLTANKDYRVMVCEYTGTPGSELYSISASAGNPANRPIGPTTQSYNVSFSNVLSNSMTVSWANGNGSNRAVFIKQTLIADFASPLNYTAYVPSTTYGTGIPLGTGWYCIYNGNGTSVNVFGLTAGSTYRLMVCDYNGTPGNEQYDTDMAAGNPATMTLITQATNIVFSNLLPTSMDLSWTRGGGDECVVFVKQTNNGSASLTNYITYNDNGNFGSGSSEGTGWYCVYKGSGTNVSVTGLTANKDYRVMVCEYTGAPGSELYSVSASAGNPANRPIGPTTQSYNVSFSNVLTNSMTVSWANGNGSNRAVFIKQTSIAESASPSNYTAYIPSATYGTGIPLGTGWYCIYNGSGTSVNVYGLTAGSTYRVMVCDYNGTPGNEQYDTDMAVGNPATMTLTSQATNIVFNNVLPASMDLSWTRGGGNGCVVFVKQANSGSASLANSTTYNDNGIFGYGTSEGTGWYCVYKGSGTNVSVTGLTANKDYRVMVCEYTGASGSELYNVNASVGNPANRPVGPTTQSYNVSFSNVLSNSMTVSWANGNGSNRAVFIKQTSIAENASPLNYTTYTPSTTYGTGIPLGTGWYCIYNGSGTSVNVYGLTAGSTYRVMVCDYNGTSGNEQYDTDMAAGNPSSVQLSIQASNIVFNNVLPTSMDIAWSRGSGSGCIVFVKASITSGNATPINNVTYKSDTIFGAGDIESTGWYCVYKGTGTNVSVSNLMVGTSYRVMVCEFAGAAGSEQYNISSAANNPANKPAIPITPVTQASNIVFSNVMLTSISVSWTNGTGSSRAVFIKQTTANESASPNNNTTYLPSTTYGNGRQIDLTGWYCIYNGSGTSVNVYGLTAGSTYRVMVCDMNGSPGSEQYNTTTVATNPLSIPIALQATNISFSNIQPTSIDVLWNRGTGDSCALFVKLGNAGNAFPVNGVIYKANGTFQSGSQIGSTGWYCVYKGKGQNATIAGLNTNQIYRVMACEYSNSGGNIQYNISTSQGNPVNTLPSVPAIPAIDIVFKNITSNYLTVSWTNGDGSNRAVFMKETTGLESATPFNNTYLPNSTFGNGSQINTTGWYCIYNGTGNTVNVFGLTAGSTYRVMVCEYNGSPGLEQYNIGTAANNPASIQLLLQASNVIVSNIQPAALDLSWSRGNGDSCAVFVKQTTSGNAIPVNGTVYTPNSTFTSGSQIGASGWYCVYTGIGTATTVTNLNTNNTYQIMVCEYTGGVGSSFYNTSTSLNNPVTTPIKPVQSTNVLFNNVTTNSMNVTWSNGKGAYRAVFVRQTSISEYASPTNNTTYTANTVFGIGDQIGSSGWFCVYSGTGSGVSITGLISGNTYCVMVCDYNGTPGTEIYNTDITLGNPASIQLTLQANNIVFSNVQATSMDLAWTRGTGSACVVFVKQANSGTVTLTNNIGYTANNNFGSGSPDGTGWFCVYKGAGTTISVTGLLANADYRVMVCEYSGSSGNELYNPSTTSTGNPANRPLTPITQASNIWFNNATASSMTVNWTNGNGTKRAVFIKQTNGIESAIPVANTSYTPNTIFGSGSEIGVSGWYCVLNGTANTVILTGLTSGQTYRVMVCEYNGIPGNELYNKDNYINNPASIQLSVQATNIVFSNVQPSSTNISWTRGTGSGCVVFMKQTNTGSVSLANNITYTASSAFGGGSPDGNGWYCVYKGTGTTASVTGLIPSKDYRVMVCEYSGTSGNEFYNSSILPTGNPANKPLPPATQASNVWFSNITNNTMTVNWSNGNGSKRAVFIKQTIGIESALPATDTTYSAQTIFGNGKQIGATGWYCIYNNTGASVNVTGLTPGTTYRVMVCEYNGTAGVEKYNIDLAINNPANVTLTFQATNVLFTNIQPTSMNLSWTRGSDSECVVFVKQTNTGNVSLSDNTTYTGNSVLGAGSPDGTGWYCVYKGTGHNVSVTGLTINMNYRVMVCEFHGSVGNETYNSATATGNPANKTIPPATQANNVTFSNVLVGKTNVSWTRGNGVSCAVFMKQTPSIIETAAPVNNTVYNFTGSIINGTQIGATGWFCVYKGTGTNTLVTGLTGGTTYRVMVCEYNGVVNGEQFNVASAANNPANVTTISTKTNQTITFNALAPRQYGSADFDPGATVTSGLPITYTSSDLSIATIIAGKVHIVGMGTTIITASQSGDIDYNAATSVAQSLTTDMGTQGINFTPLPIKQYGDADFDPGAIASSGLPVTYSSNNTNVATIVNNKIHIVGTGTTSISAYQPGNSYFYPASSVFQTLTIGKASQSITFNAFPTATFEDNDIDPGATSSSGLFITYTSTNTNVASIVGGRIHIVGAGAVNILATQSGNAYFNAATTVPRTLTINKANQTITFGAIPALIYEDIYLDPATTSSGLNVDYISDNTSVAEIFNGKIHIVGAGIATISAIQPGNDNYNAATDCSQTLTVQKADQTITFGLLPSGVFGDPDYDLNATASSGLPVSYLSDNISVATIVNGKIHIVGSGSANIIASQPGDFRYNPAAVNISQPFTVSDATQTITFSSLPAKTYGDIDFNLLATASSGLPVSFSSDNTSVATVVNGTVHIVSPGIANIKASQPGDADFGRAPYVIQPLTVNKASQTITFGSLASKTFGDPDFALSATASSGLSLTYISDNTSVATIVTGNIHIVGAGSATIYAMQPGNTNYNGATMVSQTLTVDKASQTITFNPLADKVYTDADFSPGAISSLGFPIAYSSNNPDVAMIVGNKIHIMGVGTATITASQPGNSNYNAAAPISQTLTVNKAPQSITFNAIPAKIYGSADFNLSATSGSGLDISYTSSNPSVATVINGTVHILMVGSTTISANQAGDDNFTAAATRTQTLIVTKAYQAITFNELPAKIYGEDDFSLDAESSAGLAITYSNSNSDVAVINNGWLHIVGAGTTTITASQNGNANYSAATSVSHILKVNKHSQELYFDTIPERTYGDEDFDPGAVTSSGLAVTYYSNNPGVAIIKIGKIHIVGAGSAIITARQAGNNNYIAGTDISQIFKVNKAVVIVTADNASRKYNMANPTFTCSYEGFVNGDDYTGIDSKPYIITDATISSNPGKYDLVPQSGQDNNYEFSYQKGYLLVLGTTPLKPSKPFGNNLLCINSESQTYNTSGGIFSTTYVWEIKPSNAGKFTGTDKSISVNFDDSFTGKVSINVRGKNNLGISESSDTLYVDILPKPSIPEISSRGRYCSNNPLGDSILIANSQPLYNYQLYENGNSVGSEIQGNGNKIGWYDLKYGTYSIIETICHITIDSSIIIKEVSPSSSQPKLHLKWNDVLVCLKNNDSIINYKWYKDGELLEGENNQFLWTQQKKGNYAVKTTDDSGCEFLSESAFVELVTKGIIYPNPNHGEFKVSFTSQDKGHVILKVSNMNSLPVKNYSYQKDNDIFEQDVSIPGLSAGIYFIDVILNGKRVFYEKLIIE